MDECFLLTKEFKNAYVLVTFTQHIFQIHLDKLSQCISRINNSNCNIDNGRLYLIHIYLIGNIAKHFINKKQFNAQFAQIKLLHNTIFEQVSIKCPSRYFSSLADSVYKEFISGINQIEKDYKTARRDRLQQVGVKSSIDKWFALKHYQKWQIGLTIATILSLAVAVIISIKNDHKALKKEHKENIKEVTLVQSREEPVTEETSHDKQEKVIVGEKTRKIIDQPRDKISRA